MKILNKFIWSKKEPSNKNDIWFDGSTWRMYTEEAWQSFTLPVDAADKVAKVIENASEVYQEKLNAGYGIVIEGNTISVDDSILYDDSDVWEAIETLQQNKVEQIQLNDYVPLDRYSSTSQVLMDNISELASSKADKAKTEQELNKKLNKTDVATINGQSLIEGGNVVIEGGDSSHNIGSIDLFEQIIAQKQNHDLTLEDKEAILNGKVITTSVGEAVVPTISINSIEGLGHMLMFHFNERLYSMCVMWNDDRCYINGFFSFSVHSRLYADSELSETSENSVQNKVVTEKLTELFGRSEALLRGLDKKIDRETAMEYIEELQAKDTQHDAKLTQLSAKALKNIELFLVSEPTEEFFADIQNTDTAIKEWKESGERRNVLFKVTAEFNDIDLPIGIINAEGTYTFEEAKNNLMTFVNFQNQMYYQLGILSFSEMGATSEQMGLPSGIEYVCVYDGRTPLTETISYGSDFLIDPQFKLLSISPSSPTVKRISNATPRVQHITYENLVIRRKNGNLVAGMQYRITDYVTTTAQENTRSAGHQFDVIVTADNENTLNEVARACRSEFDIEKYKDAYSSTLGENMSYIGLYQYEGKEYHLYESINTSHKVQMLVDFYRVDKLYEEGTIEYPYCIYPHYAKFIEAVDWENGYDFGENICFKLNPIVTYFKDSNLAAWQIWYSLDNDVERFAWADAQNGKGVIYRMIDEWNNDVPYDFKNIQFKRNLTFENGYAEYSEDGEEAWVYTFAGQSYHINNDEWSGMLDGSLESPFGHMSDENTSTFHDNTIKPYIMVYNGNDIYLECGRIYLNDIVFLGYWEEIGSANDEDMPYYYACCCYSNSFGNNCHSNTFGNSCYSNTFGNSCYSNTFGNSCYSNTFGNNSQSNELKAYYRYITFGEGVQYVTLQNNTEGGYENIVQNYRVANGTHGEDGNPLVVDVTRNMGSETFIGMDSNDELKVFCLADLLNS